MKSLKISVLFLLVAALFSGCNEKESKYDRPEWLAGKVFTQIQDQEDLSIFAHCLQLTGYDTILDRSGSYTVFAPNNTAFQEYLDANPSFTTVEDIPIGILTELVKYHIVQNPWSKIQLQTLDVYGWIDTLDINNNKPRGFKRETLLLEKDRFYGVAPGSKDRVKIVDSTLTDLHRRVARDSRKFVPIFFKDYFDIYDLSPNDYSFYFDRSIENSSDLYFAGAKIIGDEVFAENGFVYNIDKVIDPLPNAYEILEKGSGNYTYTRFLDLINRFPVFSYNEDKTFNQPGADQGLAVDSLFDLTYPDLTFEITNEKTTPPAGTFGLPADVSIRYHHGLVAPTDDAFTAFENEYLVGSGKWGSLEATPLNIKRIIANTYMADYPIFPTDFRNGYYNGEKDRVVLDENDFIQKQFGSNCSFIGTTAAIVPRVFKSVAGPVYLRKGYSKVMYAIENAGLLPALKRENKNYMFFVESDANTSADSSLLYDPIDERFFLYQIGEAGSAPRRFGLNTNDLRTLLLNHIALDNPRRIARKEFIKNLAGNYIVVNNETGVFSGTAPTTTGYQGQSLVDIIPTQISTEADNGITYDIEDWFTFSASDMFQVISTYYPYFQQLLKNAGLATNLLYNFVSANENYTVFIPSEQALIDYQVDTLTTAELKQFLLFHFVQGAIIFTDGNASSGYYETLRVDEKSTEFTTVYTKIYIETGVDRIGFRAKNGSEYTFFEESSNTNILLGRILGETDDTFLNTVNNGVVHQMNQVLIYDLLDTE
ncbi:MAG: fasciclin domain-containing protein [Bacteroidota bacterium]